MKTNVQIKDEPVEFQVNELLRLYGYNLTNQTSTKKTIVNQEQEPSTCAWCQKLGIRSFTLRTDDGDSKTLCSEVCFNHYRRASFKKNKGSELDIEHNILPIVSTIKTKSSEKKNGSDKREQQLIDLNKRKIILPLRRSTPTNTKTKTNGINQKISPSSSKRQRSSSSSSPPPPSSNGKILRVDQTPIPPMNLTWQPSVLLPSTLPWPSPIDINRFQYPFFPPPLPPVPAPIPPSLPALPSSSSSNLFTTLSKGTLSNFTCILPTFIPLPIPIPIPLCLPCNKCSTEVNDQRCQTIIESDTHQKRTRRISI